MSFIHNLTVISGDITGDEKWPTGEVGDLAMNGKKVKRFVMGTVYNAISDGLLVADDSTDNGALLTTFIGTLSDGDVIYFPKGTYRFSSSVSTSKALKFIGEGALLKTVSNIPILNIGSATSFNIAGIDFLGNDSGAGQYGLQITSVSEWSVDSCNFTDFNTAAFLAQTSGGTEYNGNYLANCKFISCAGIGIDLGSNAEYITVDSCSARACGTGLRTNGANNTIIGGNYSGNTTGISVIGGANQKIQILGVKANHCTTGISVSGTGLQVDIHAHCYASSIVLDGCKYARFSGAMSTGSFQIINIPANGRIDIMHADLTPSTLTITGLADTAPNKALLRFNDNNIHGSPTVNWDGTGTIVQSGNYDDSLNVFTIT